MIPLLILRPEPGASVTAGRAKVLGLLPIVCPLFAIHPVKCEAPDPALFDTLILTSANAIRYGGEMTQHYRTLPTYTVGRATAAAARDAGFTQVTECTGNIVDMLQLVIAAGHTRPLHLAGKDRIPYPDTPFTITTRTVYEARPVDATIPEGRCVALLHSARAATRFAKLCPKSEVVDIVTISAAVASAAGQGWRSVTISPAPDDNAMLALAAMLCDGAPMPSGPE